jgi:hypothetical protein
MPRPALRPARAGVQRRASCSNSPTRTCAGGRTVPGRRHGQKGWRTVDRIYDGFQKTTSLEFVCRDLAYGRRGSRSSPGWWGCAGRKWRTGSGCRVHLVAGRWEVGGLRDDTAAAIGRCWCCMGNQPRVHHLPRRLPVSKNRQLNDKRKRRRPLTLILTPRTTRRDVIHWD